MSIIRSARALLLSAALLCAAAPAPAAAAGNPCEDYAWKQYNECLMTSPTEWEKRECDWEFMVDITLCTVVPFLVVWGVLAVL